MKIIIGLLTLTGALNCFGADSAECELTVNGAVAGKKKVFHMDYNVTLQMKLEYRTTGDGPSREALVFYKTSASPKATGLIVNIKAPEYAQLTQSRVVTPDFSKNLTVIDDAGNEISVRCQIL